jgi:hypothetical protein
MARPQLIAERDLRLIKRWPRLHGDSDQVIETFGHPQIGFVKKLRAARIIAYGTWRKAFSSVPPIRRPMIISVAQPTRMDV